MSQLVNRMRNDPKNLRILSGVGPRNSTKRLDSARCLLPLRDLHRVDVEFLGDLLDGFDALERLKRHAGLEFGVVSSAFAFHFVCVRFGLNAAPTHHNHSLASGLIFWGRLNTSKYIRTRSGGLGSRTRGACKY